MSWTTTRKAHDRQICLRAMTLFALLTLLENMPVAAATPVAHGKEKSHHGSRDEEESEESIAQLDTCKTLGQWQLETCKHMYMPLSTPLPIKDAVKVCKNNGGVLAMPKTQDQIRQLSGIYSATGFEADQFFVGAMSVGIHPYFRWFDGSSVQLELLPFLDTLDLQSFAEDAIGTAIFLCIKLDINSQKLLPTKCARAETFTCEFCLKLPPEIEECLHRCHCQNSTHKNHGPNEKQNFHLICTPLRTKCQDWPGCMTVHKARDICSTLPCPLNRFGPNCDQICNCHGDELHFEPCDPVTGECKGSGNCHYGWHGPACNQTKCPLHYYGYQCSDYCYCYNGQQCSMIGECIGGCPEGAIGHHCDVAPNCPPGSFGIDCTHLCHCANSSQCSNDGICLKTDRCEYGWHGRSCNVTDCPRGMWKIREPFCTGICACVHGQQCNYLNGSCEKGCLHGWIGPSCNKTVCAMDHWGESCEQACECILFGEHVPCDMTTGRCPQDLFIEHVPVCEDPTQWGPGCNYSCMTEACLVCEPQRGDLCRVCQLGFVELPGKICHAPCEKGTFGPNCSEVCPYECPDDCNRKHGYCDDIYFIEKVTEVSAITISIIIALVLMYISIATRCFEDETDRRKNKLKAAASVHVSKSKSSSFSDLRRASMGAPPKQKKAKPHRKLRHYDSF